jgi:hypothetical protein
METPKFIQNIDWGLLKTQKFDLFQTIEDLELEAKNAKSAGEKELGDRYINQVNSIHGIISLIDNVQDYAVDELGMDENTIFELESE